MDDKHRWVPIAGEEARGRGYCFVHREWCGLKETDVAAGLAPVAAYRAPHVPTSRPDERDRGETREELTVRVYLSILTYWVAAGSRASVYGLAETVVEVIRPAEEPGT